MSALPCITVANFQKLKRAYEHIGTRGAVLHHSAETVLCYRNCFFSSFSFSEYQQWGKKTCPCCRTGLACLSNHYLFDWYPWFSDVCFTIETEIWPHKTVCLVSAIVFTGGCGWRAAKRFYIDIYWQFGMDYLVNAKKLLSYGTTSWAFYNLNLISRFICTAERWNRNYWENAFETSRNLRIKASRLK